MGHSRKFMVLGVKGRYRVAEVKCALSRSNGENTESSSFTLDHDISPLTMRITGISFGI